MADSWLTRYPRYNHSEDDTQPMPIRKAEIMNNAWNEKFVVDPTPQKAEKAAQYAASTAHLVNIKASVGIPFIQASVTGVLIGMMAGLVAWYFHVEAWATVIAAAGLFVTAAFWLALMMNWVKILTLIEYIVKQDITGDGKIGFNRKSPEITVNVKSEDGRHTTRQVLPYADRLPEFAERAMELTDKGDKLTDRAIASGFRKVLSPKKWHDVRDIFIKRGWLVWDDPDNHKAGLNLTQTGYAACRGLTTSPTLSDE